ncbi:DNA topoisomerase 3 [Lactococcus lactis]|uniref:DNA topoisomerase 3 n=1 Tax=Lactococcus lactis TaxID=1358 RepID=UPI00288C9DA9|nr:DNA topoisomerase 3 [Lactococcus lactis]MDT2935510.1 DNA topoisomerase 3 [Lactococcus lactis]
MQLIIAEKPSVATTIATVLSATQKKDGYIEGNGFIVSWCVGHLVGLAEAAAYGEQYKKWSYEALPILPHEWQYTVAADKQKQFKILKELMHRTDVTELVNACDAGREGELIFRFVYLMAKCKKPFSRLWISSMEDKAIKQGFENLKDGQEYDALYSSAICRAKADWIIGINATRLFSCLYDKTLNVGRVQTPTLKILTDRDAAITGFKKEKYYHVRLNLDRVEATSGRISTADEAATLKTACEISQAVCVSLTKEKKTVAPPKLFDLTGLQREANRIYGYTAKQTLDLAQALYEKRLLTYPRTDSQFLTDDMGGTAASVAALLMVKLPFLQGADVSPDFTRVLNSKKVSDHHAIIPTAQIEKTDLATLPESERNILTLAGVRLLCATAEPHSFEAVTAVFDCAGKEFTAKGKTILCAGWKEIDRLFRATLKVKPDTDDEEAILALDFSEGQTFDNPPARATEHNTTPPTPHNEATLLSAMERAGSADTDEDAERKGLGTPATRAAVIEKLVKGGFVERKGKQLIPTKDGNNLICVLPDTLTSPQLTAEWENSLTQIAKGAADPAAFMSGIEEMARVLVETYPFLADNKKDLFQRDKPLVGKCPRCGGNVYEGKKNYYCSNKDCAFVMWKNDRFFEERKTTFTVKIAAALLADGKAKVKKLYAPKSGKTYDGTVLLADTGGKYVNYRIEIQRDKELS